MDEIRSAQVFDVNMSIYKFRTSKLEDNETPDASFYRRGAAVMKKKSIKENSPRESEESK